MKDLVITENVKNLLLNSDFLELVFGSLIDGSNVNSQKPASIKRILQSYKLEEILKAKYILEHLHEDFGLTSEIDLEEVRTRIKYRLKC